MTDVDATQPPSIAVPARSAWSSLLPTAPPSYEEIRMHMLQLIEPSAMNFVTKNTYKHLYLIVRRDEWILNSELYTGGKGTSKNHPYIKCVDINRLDAMASRKFFRNEYEKCIQSLDGTSQSVWRWTTKMLRFNNRDVNECVRNAFSQQRAHIDEISPLIVDNDEYCLVIIPQNENLDVLFDCKNMNYPRIFTALNKNVDSHCVVYPLRYDTRSLKVALPSDSEIESRLIKQDSLAQ